MPDLEQVTRSVIAIALGVAVQRAATIGGLAPTRRCQPIARLIPAFRPPPRPSRGPPPLPPTRPPPPTPHRTLRIAHTPPPPPPPPPRPPPPPAPPPTPPPPP